MRELLLVLIFFCNICQGGIDEERSSSAHRLDNQANANKRKIEIRSADSTEFTEKRRKQECSVFSNENANIINRFKKNKINDVKDIFKAIESHHHYCPHFHSAKALALISNGFSNNNDALRIIAGQVASSNTDLSGRDWTAQHLAMVANGLSKAAGQRVTKALKKIAGQVASSNTDLSGWLVQDLAMVANGLSKWRSYTSETLIVKLIKAYNEGGDRDDDCGLILLKSLCQLTLSSNESIDGGIRLALSMLDNFELKEGKYKVWFYWCSTLLCFVALEKYNDKYMDEVTVLFNCLNFSGVQEDYQIAPWQIAFIKIYHKESALGLQELQELQELQCSWDKASISNTQKTVFNKIKEKIDDEGVIVELEKPIMLFPVDIYIKSRTSSILCIEVDGPSHFLEDDDGKLYELAKHRFSKKIISEILGYQLLSINYREIESEKLDEFTDRVVENLNDEG